MHAATFNRVMVLNRRNQVFRKKEICDTQCIIGTLYPVYYQTIVYPVYYRNTISRVLPDQCTHQECNSELTGR